MKRQSAVHVVHVECTLKHQRALGYDQVTQRQSEVSARCARCSPPFLRKRNKRDRERGAGAGAGVCKRIKTFLQFFLRMSFQRAQRALDPCVALFHIVIIECTLKKTTCTTCTNCDQRALRQLPGSMTMADISTSCEKRCYFCLCELCKVALCKVCEKVCELFHYLANPSPTHKKRIKLIGA